ncbi:hypothetical protein ECMP02155211_4674 [Escherichia coli MP021552.11]|nr:hypothetical protein ECMP02155211_4674 [Escherichia coli MP021552.11]
MLTLCHFLKLFMLHFDFPSKIITRIPVLFMYIYIYFWVMLPTY